MTALIDADVIVYRAISVTTSEVDWDGDGALPLHNLPAAKQIADMLVKDWTNMARKKKTLLVFSDRSKPLASFRHNVHPHYKGNRADEKPPMHNAIHDYLYDRYPSVFLKDFEGDDLMGLMATDSAAYTMVSIDKDMTTLPARLVNPMDKEPAPRKIGLREANYNWMFQTICGDTVDNFKGAPGVGKVGAEKALAGCENFGELSFAAARMFSEQSLKDSAYTKFVNWKDKERGTPDPFSEFLMNARCARILRVGDYDKVKHLVKMWHPDPSNEWWANPYHEVPDV